MDEALNAHPDVAQILVKLFSDALTESRGKVKELELSLSEKAESELITKAPALAELQVLYSAEKESGFELLSALEERVLDLNSKEADVKEQLHLVAQEGKSFARQKAAKISSASTLSSEGVGKERAVQLLHEKYDAATGEKIALQKSLETTASDMAAQEAALNQVVNETILFAQADAQTAEFLRSEAAEELQRQPSKKANPSSFLKPHSSPKRWWTMTSDSAPCRRFYLTGILQNVESVAATGEQGHAKVVLEVEISALADIRDADKAQIFVLEDALKASNAEFEELRNKNKQAKLAAMDMVNTSSADKAQMIALEDVASVESEDVELVELREQIKSNAMDLKTALKARDAKLTGLQNENEQLKSTTVDLEEKLVSAGESHKAQIEKLKYILRATDVELMDLQNKNEQIKSTAKSLQKKLLAAETSRHEQAEAATHLVKLTRQLKDLQREKSAWVGQQAELKQVADEERRASEKKLNSALRANAMLQTAYLSLHKSHHQLVKERGAVEPSVNQAGTPAPAFPHAQSAAGSHSDRQYENGRHEEQRVGAYTSSLPSPVWSESEADDRMVHSEELLHFFALIYIDVQSLNAEHAPGISERALYNKFMARLPSPNRPIGFGALEPIHAVPQLDAFSHGLKTERQGVHFPKRSFFTHLDCIHALVFAPLHEYWDPAEKRDTFSNMGKFCSQTFDLFMNRGSIVYYAGIYTMHNLRGEHAPGSDIPADVSPTAIHHVARLGNRKMPDCFPDGKMKLRLRYLASTNEGMKRKASTADSPRRRWFGENAEDAVVASERRHIF
ncbi:hypothetical protein C8J57DRAFT_1258389 [Mycena rebaudengoi]|nr:hypothetical protein C8J57DRAFT_1258389 [Mycena rebaudengoi]